MNNDNTNFDAYLARSIMENTELERERESKKEKVDLREIQIEARKQKERFELEELEKIREEKRQKLYPFVNETRTLF